ncbi:putative reverse transcriptase domain-containing protein, partial [Tanacetum coccineum]
TMIKWIMECVSSTSFLINVNGDLKGFFKGKRGLRQGDPLSPYLFTLVMEVLNLMIKRNIAMNPHFKYHWQCKDLKLTHLCFADDLMLFCHGNSKSVTVLKNALDEFGSVSGLFPSFPKSTVFFGNVKDSSKAKILMVMPFSEGKLPVRYLGVPGKSRIKWSDVCKPKVEGGLGIKSLETWNIALISKHIWNIINKKDSLWVKWVHLYKLKGRNFWDVPENEGSSWSWKKILRYRGMLRRHIVHRIGDGLSTSLWYDSWHAICPLSDFISKRKIYYSGLSLDCNVANVIENGMWKWPSVLSEEFDGINAIEPPLLIEGSVLNSLVKTLLVSQCIPRHAFMVWLAIHGRLKTQDLMGVWEKKDDMRCVFLAKCPRIARSFILLNGSILTGFGNCLKCMVRKEHAPYGASIYFLWQERNIRMFQDKARSVDTLVALIKDTVRLRVMSLSLNDSAQVSEAANLWNFHVDREFLGILLLWCGSSMLRVWRSGLLLPALLLGLGLCVIHLSVRLPTLCFLGLCFIFMMWFPSMSTSMRAVLLRRWTRGLL